MTHVLYELGASSLGMPVSVVALAAGFYRLHASAVESSHLRMSNAFTLSPLSAVDARRELHALAFHGVHMHAADAGSTWGCQRLLLYKLACMTPRKVLSQLLLDVH